MKNLTMCVAALLLIYILSYSLLAIFIRTKSSPLELRALTENEEIEVYLLNKTIENGLSYRQFRLLKRIIWCESSFNPLAQNTKSSDSGLFQINESSWDERAQELGLNYKNNWKHNIDMGLIVFKEQGIDAWKWSKSCWN